MRVARERNADAVAGPQRNAVGFTAADADADTDAHADPIARAGPAEGRRSTGPVHDAATITDTGTAPNRLAITAPKRRPITHAEHAPGNGRNADTCRNADTGPKRRTIGATVNKPLPVGDTNAGINAQT